MRADIDDREEGTEALIFEVESCFTQFCEQNKDLAQVGAACFNMEESRAPGTRGCKVLEAKRRKASPRR